MLIQTSRLFKLRNYENIFCLNGDYLSLRENVTFDRETCETYELFVNKFRILVKILDLNDNAPHFSQTNDLDESGLLKKEEE